MTDSTSKYWGPGAHQRRAMKLLQGGLVGGHIVGFLATVTWFVMRGQQAAGWALLASASVIIFFLLGQGLQVVFAHKAPQQLMNVTLIAYGLRVLGLFGLFGAIQRLAPEAFDAHRLVIVSSVIAVVFAWVGAEIVVFRRLRIPTYDVEYVPPSDGPGRM